MDTRKLLGHAEDEARFNVGDVVWLAVSGPWTITARYWSPRKGSVLYDLRGSRGGDLCKYEQHLVYAERQHDGTARVHRAQPRFPLARAVTYRGERAVVIGHAHTPKGEVLYRLKAIPHGKEVLFHEEVPEGELAWRMPGT